MTDDQIRQHLNNIISDANAAKSLLDGTSPGPGPGPGPEPEPPPTGDYELRTVGKTWRLVGRVDDFSQALVFPMMALEPPGFTAATIQMELEIGPEWEGLHCFFDLYEDAGKWRGDHCILVNRGANGAMAVSHTLEGKETTPVRKNLPISSGQRLSLIAQLANGVWTVTAGTATVTMESPPLTSYQLRLQLGQNQDESHASNAGTKLLSMSGSVA